MAYLENARLRLRALEPEDLDILYKWENNTALWIHGNTLSPYSRYLLKQYIADSAAGLEVQKQLRLIIETKAGESVGIIDLYDYDSFHSRAGVGLLIAPEYQHRGFGTEAVALMEAYAFQYLHLHQLFVHVPENNKASLSLFVRNGFERSGKLNDWLFLPDGYENVIVLQKISSSKVI